MDSTCSNPSLNPDSVVGQTEPEKKNGHPHAQGHASSLNLKATQRRNNKRAIPITNRLFGPQGEQWDRFLTVKAANPNMSDLEFENKLLKTTKDAEITFRTDKDNTKIIRAKDENQAKQLQSIKQLGATQVEITPHKTLNIKRGTIICNHINYGETPFLNSGQLIKENLELRNHKIEEVEVYEIPARSKIFNIKVAKISFHTQTLPTKVVIGGEVMKVKPYTPTPMQCKNCWRYRHTAKKCIKKMEGISHCVKCGETNHTLQECRKTKKCMNCSGPHYSNSRECPHYDYHTAITELWENWGMPFYKAKQHLRDEGLYPSLTYAGAAATEVATVPPIGRKHTQKHQAQEQQQRKMEQESVETLDETFLSLPEPGEITFLA